MTILLSESAGSAEKFRLTLGNDVAVASSPRELLDMVEANPQELLIVVAPEVPLATALELAKHYRLARPALGLVLVRQRLEVSVLSQAMQPNCWRQANAAWESVRCSRTSNRSLPQLNEAR
jgi:pilus assembly protein CpaE